jgi:hypothetical protein
MSTIGGVVQEIGIPIDLSKGEFNGTIFKDGKLQLLENGVDDLGQVVYVANGYWISNIVNIQNKFHAFKNVVKNLVKEGDASCLVSVSTSENGTSWSPFVYTDENGSIVNEGVSKYAKVKIELFGSLNLSEMFVDHSKYVSEFIDYQNNGVKIKHDYEYQMTKDNTWSEDGTLHRKLITRSDWAKIGRLQVSDSNNKTLFLHDGEYKKIEQPYDYTSLLETAITANSKLTNWFKFDEASGNVTNSKGTAVGTVTNAIRVSGWNGEGNAISFNGTNSYVQFNAGIIPLGEKSVRFKIKRNGNPSNVEMILSSDNYDSSKNGFRCLLNTDGTILMGAVRGIVGTSLFMLTSTISVCDDQWHDILLTWDGTTRESGVKLYIDDLFIPNVTATATTTAESNPQNNLCMGARLNSNGGARDFYFKGEIDSFETYNKVLTIDEIFEIGNKVVTVVSEEAPTVPQFISAMDSLDILTREVTSLELPMANKSEILDANDEGKVFGKTIDLKKYMDIRTINVEVE